jgi:hypothetical protein
MKQLISIKLAIIFITLIIVELFISFPCIAIQETKPAVIPFQNIDLVGGINYKLLDFPKLLSKYSTLINSNQKAATKHINELIAKKDYETALLNTLLFINSFKEHGLKGRGFLVRIYMGQGNTEAARQWLFDEKGLPTLSGFEIKMSGLGDELRQLIKDPKSQKIKHNRIKLSQLKRKVYELYYRRNYEDLIKYSKSMIEDEKLGPLTIYKKPSGERRDDWVREIHRAINKTTYKELYFYLTHAYAQIGDIKNAMIWKEKFSELQHYPYYSGEPSANLFASLEKATSKIEKTSDSKEIMKNLEAKNVKLSKENQAYKRQIGVLKAQISTLDSKISKVPSSTKKPKLNAEETVEQYWITFYKYDYRNIDKYVCSDIADRLSTGLESARNKQINNLYDPAHGVSEGMAIKAVNKMKVDTSHLEIFSTGQGNKVRVTTEGFIIQTTIDPESGQEMPLKMDVNEVYPLQKINDRWIICPE